MTDTSPFRYLQKTRFILTRIVSFNILYRSTRIALFDFDFSCIDNSPYEEEEEETE